MYLNLEDDIVVVPQLIIRFVNKKTMSSVEYLREFVNERLTAAADEIFGVFQKTIIEYEEEIDRQRRLLDIVWKPEIKLHRIELQQQHVCIKEEEVLADQQLCIQERNSSLDQEDPEPPQIKEEQEELCTSQEGEQLVLKQETDTFMLTPTYEKSDHGKDQTLNLSVDETQSVIEEKLLSYILVKSSLVPEPKSDHQLLSNISQAAESQDQKEGQHGETRSTRNSEPKPKKIYHKKESHHNNVYNPTMSMIHCYTQTSKKSFKCDTCGKDFKYKSALQRHLRIHTGENPYSCKTCGKVFRSNTGLLVHMRTHTGEKPYLCKTCGKGFGYKSVLKTHVRIHTGEKPYSCKTCGKDFRLNGHLIVHMRRAHTGEKPYPCKICGKKYVDTSHLTQHIRIHTGEKPFLCKTCGRAFRLSGHLTIHMRRAHTGEKPYLCNICGKGFVDASHLVRHVRSHTGK